MIRILDVPKKFILKMPINYPPHQDNQPMIEEKAFEFFSTQEINSEYIYIPIHWTSWHINPNGLFGQNVQPLVNFCNELTEKYPNEKFFTIVQYDGGTLVPIDNCKIFASSGSFLSPLGKNSSYIPIPLLCNNHKGTPNKNKKYKVGYAGRDTHSIRVEMNKILSHLPDYKFALNTEKNKTEIFREILYNSIFALSPRGFGPASFRMYEAIEMQCIPIYISDQFWLPFIEYIEWDKMSLLIKDDEIASIPERVDDLIRSGEYLSMIEYGKKIYKKYLNWDGCFNTILNYIDVNYEKN